MTSSIKLELVSFSSDQILYHYHMFGVFPGIRVRKCYKDYIKPGTCFQSWWWLGCLGIRSTHDQHVLGCIHWTRAQLKLRVWDGKKCLFKTWTHFSHCSGWWFWGLILKAMILGVMVWVAPEANPETRIQGRLVFQEGGQDIPVGEWGRKTGNERKPVEAGTFVCYTHLYLSSP